jgi:ribosomal protein S21
MIRVTRKDSKESVENMVRRFSRKVQQSGVLARAKQGQYFQRSMSKPDRRRRAIVRKERKAEKVRMMRLRAEVIAL